MPKKLKILHDGDPILRIKSKKIDNKSIKSGKINSLCADMALTMEKSKGVGLAAPQIGKNIRLIIINTKEGPVSMINPEIIKASWIKEWGEEGCLSVPEIYGKVKRHKKLNCIYTNRKGEKMEMEAIGLMARVIQHEIDHLDGVLFIDKAKDLRNIKN